MFYLNALVILLLSFNLSSIATRINCGQYITLSLQPSGWARFDLLPPNLTSNWSLALYPLVGEVEIFLAYNYKPTASYWDISALASADIPFNASPVRVGCSPQPCALPAGVDAILGWQLAVKARCCTAVNTTAAIELTCIDEAGSDTYLPTAHSKRRQGNETLTKKMSVERKK